MDASLTRRGTALARARARAAAREAAGETGRREAAAALQRALDRRDNGGAPESSASWTDGIGFRDAA
ncbi:hypothetical protein [Streptomyces sp. URMC 129]|uniref:hypothetical protein n=1 Tax=Streptomyces sp. URMC 129 TaxID=3423407 RepID=UPI003F1C17C6